MGFVTCIVSALLFLHTANSYILLTANLEDVQTLAKQLIQSPVAGQIGNMVRRAATQFNRQYNDQLVKSKKGNNDPKMNAYSEENTKWAPTTDRYQDERHQDQEDEDNRVERRTDNDDSLVALGKTASLYLRSIKKMFEQL